MERWGKTTSGRRGNPSKDWRLVGHVGDIFFTFELFMENSRLKMKKM